MSMNEYEFPKGNSFRCTACTLRAYSQTEQNVTEYHCDRDAMTIGFRVLGTS